MFLFNSWYTHTTVVYVKLSNPKHKMLLLWNFPIRAYKNPQCSLTDNVYKLQSKGFPIGYAEDSAELHCNKTAKYIVAPKLQHLSMICLGCNHPSLKAVQFIAYSLRIVHKGHPQKGRGRLNCGQLWNRARRKGPRGSLQGAPSIFCFIISARFADILYA